MFCSMKYMCTFVMSKGNKQLKAKAMIQQDRIRLGSITLEVTADVTNEIRTHDHFEPMDIDIQSVYYNGNDVTELIIELEGALQIIESKIAYEL